MSKKIKAKVLSIKEKRDRIIAYDIVSIMEDAERGDCEYIVSMLTGVGTSPAVSWPVQAVLKEWEDGDYSDPEDKEARVKGSNYYIWVDHLWP